MLRLAADQARMLVALEEERSQALQREQEIKRRAEAETQRMMELIRRQVRFRGRGVRDFCAALA